VLTTQYGHYARPFQHSRLAWQRRQLNSECQGAGIHDCETIHVLVPLCRAVNLLQPTLEVEFTPVTESVRCMLLLQVVNATETQKCHDANATNFQVQGLDGEIARLYAV